MTAAPPFSRPATLPHQDICKHMRMFVLPSLRTMSPDHLVTLLWAVGKLSNQVGARGSVGG